MADVEQAFNSMQDTEAQFLNKMAARQKQLKEVAERLKRENADLRAENEMLQARNRQLKGGSATPATSTPAASGAYGASAPPKALATSTPAASASYAAPETQKTKAVPPGGSSGTGYGPGTGSSSGPGYSTGGGPSPSSSTGPPQPRTRQGAVSGGGSSGTGYGPGPDSSSGPSPFSGTGSNQIDKTVPVGSAAAAKAPEQGLAKRCQCGNVFMDDAVFCRKCGRPREGAPPPKCPQCGNIYMDDSEFCRKCGTKRDRGNAPPPDASPRSKSSESSPRMRYKQVNIIRAHDAPVHAATVGPNGLMATGSWDATVQVYDLGQDGENALVMTLGDQADNEQPIMGGLYGVAFAWTSPGVIGCASADTCCYLWDHNSGALLAKLAGHTDEVNGIVFHPTQQALCTCSDDMSAIVWDAQEGRSLRTLKEHTKAVYGATFFGKQDQNIVATCCFDKTVRIWDLKSAKVVNALQDIHDNDIIGLDYSDKTRLLATGSDDGCICIFDTRKWGDPLFRINSQVNPGLAGNEIKRCTFSPDGQKVGAGSSSMNVILYDVAGSRPEFIDALSGHSDCVFDLCWGIDSKGQEFIVDASHDTMSYVWRPY